MTALPTKPDEPLALLGGLTPQQFMRRHWQRKPLLIRQAIPDFRPGLSIADIKQLARRDEVESRLIWREGEDWRMRKGPFNRLPPARQPGWTLLAQSVDLHDDAMAQLMRRFRFISDARLDDLMISIATDGGGVGPHFDSYDVFLLQGVGRRRWRISQQKNLDLVPGLPLKILRDFVPEEEYVLEPGDMLYLPPHAAHDGVAEGDCMTLSIGFRAPSLATLARGVLDAAGDQVAANAGGDPGLYGWPPLKCPPLSKTYQDKGTGPTDTPAEVPAAMIAAAIDAARSIAFDDALAARFLGQWLTELPDAADFEPLDDDSPTDLPRSGRLVLDRCTRMMYHGDALFINGDVAAVPASPGMRALADRRQVNAGEVGARRAEREALLQWLQEGFLHHEAE